MTPDEWKQTRPEWCPHKDCQFKRRAMDSLCGGKLPDPVKHDTALNTHRVCIKDSALAGDVFDLQVNSTDLEWFRWIFDALDKKRTGWLSRGRP